MHRASRGGGDAPVRPLRARPRVPFQAVRHPVEAHSRPEVWQGWRKQRKRGPMSAKRQQTLAKLQRELKIKEKRARKLEKKQAKAATEAESSGAPQPVE